MTEDDPAAVRRPAKQAPVQHEPRRGRPSAARAEVIDRAILAVARDQFLRDGFDAVAMEQVAADARVSKGTLYARHPSKEALFEAVIADSIRIWSTRAAAHDDLLTEDIEQRLRHHARTIARAMLDPEVHAIQRLVYSVAPRFPRMAAALHDRGYRYIVGILTNDIARAGAEGGRPARDPEGVAQLIVTAMSGYDLQQAANAQMNTIEAFGDRIVDLVMAARAAW